MGTWYEDSEHSLEARRAAERSKREMEDAEYDQRQAEEKAARASREARDQRQRAEALRSERDELSENYDAAIASLEAQLERQWGRTLLVSRALAALLVASHNVTIKSEVPANMEAWEKAVKDAAELVVLCTEEDE